MTLNEVFIQDTAVLQWIHFAKCVHFRWEMFDDAPFPALQIVEEIVGGIAEKIPPPFNVQEVMEKYPVLYEESMNTVLTQEVIR